MANESSFRVISVECPHCKVKQKVHVAGRPGIAQTGSQYLSCINCDSEFDVMLPDKIVGGPFPL
jgi:hypothetical protein